MNPWGVYKGNEVTCDSPLSVFFFFLALFIIAWDPVIALSFREVGRRPASLQNLLPGFVLSVFACPLVHLDLRLSVRLKGAGKLGDKSLRAESPLKRKYESFTGKTREWGQPSRLSRSSTQIYRGSSEESSPLFWVGQANSLPQPGSDKQTVNNC